MQNTQRVRPVITQWLGLERRTGIADGQLADMRGLSTANAPQLVTCPPREVLYAHAGAAQGLFTCTSGLVSIAGGVLYIDGRQVMTGLLREGMKAVVEFWGKLCIFPDKKTYDLKTGTPGSIGNGKAYPEAGACPDIKYACIHDNRVFGAAGSSLYACALGNVQDWTTFVDADGNPSDLHAWAQDVASPGDFVGMIEHDDHVIAFKPGYMHELYGAMPSKYMLRDDPVAGLVSGGAMAALGGALYFADRSGLRRYAGGVPATISHALDRTDFAGACCAADYRFVYLGVGGDLYAFDSFTQLWARTDALDVHALCLHNHTVHAQLAGGEVVRLGTGAEPVVWYAETGPMLHSLTGLSVVSRIDLRFAFADRGGEIRVLLSADGGEWTEVLYIGAADREAGGQTMAGIQSARIATPKCMSYRLRIEGRGHCVVYELQRTALAGGDAT